MQVRFGTDGLRGKANSELTPELMVRLGRAIVDELGAGAYVIGRDTRLSGPMLVGALAAGISAQGGRVVDLGVLPTAAVSFAARRLGVPGVVVSASHNHFQDNGVKIFDRDGSKLARRLEAAIEARLEAGPEPHVGDLGPIERRDDLLDEYVDFLLHTLQGRSLQGLAVVLDCANGAASAVGPRVFEAAGAQVEAIASEPDGTNINAACGSTAPDKLARRVRETGADMGLAFDGDADRVVALDHRGDMVDGDQMLVLFARDLLGRGMLKGGAVVVTIMANLGLRHSMAELGVRVVETPVGDRNVAEAMRREGLVLGGEQSGHIVFGDIAMTGDGLLTGLLLADLGVRSGVSLADLAGSAMQKYPQLLANVRVASPSQLDGASAVWEAVEEQKKALGPDGRILVRASGTEPVVRVMVEAFDPHRAESCLAKLVAVVEEVLGRS